MTNYKPVSQAKNPFSRRLPPVAGRLAAGTNLDRLILALLIFIPRLLDLGVFLTADEPLFLAQARAFGRGLSHGDFGQTLGLGYPAVTLAWWSAPIVSLFPAEPGAYLAGRMGTALATGLLLLILFEPARLLLGRRPALVGVGLLALDPYTLAYSRLLHIAAPLALFMTLAGLTFLLWLRDEGRRWLFLAGLFTGLALLTKSTALLLGPMLVAAGIGWSVPGGRGRAKRLLATIRGLIVIALIAAVVFFTLWPAMWDRPAQALDLTFGKLLTDREAGTGNLGLFWLGRFVEDPGPAFYPVAFLLKATPWLLIGLIVSFRDQLAGLKQSLYPPSTPSQPPTANCQLSITFPLWLFALSYLIIMTLASKKSIRYMLPAFPVFYLLAGLALYRLLASVRQGRAASWLSRRLKPRAIPLPGYKGMVTGFLALVLLLPIFYHPYYFTYYNPLLLGWRWAPQTLLVGWGEGLDQAAEYLNHQPPATVSAWYEWLFPILYYNGRVEPVVPPENLITADQTVLYINQVQRDIPNPNIIHYFRARRRPEYTVRLAGIDYAWVYPGPLAGAGATDPDPAYALGGDFGAEMRLLGYDLGPRPRSGESLIVTLYWRVLTAPPAARFVYVRLVDERGHIWAAADSPPLMGLWPVDRWQPGMLLEDAQALSIPAGTPPGAYRLEVGVYEPASGQTLPAAGQPLGRGGGLLLGEAQVEWQALPAEPDLPHQADARLAPEARLVGYTWPVTQATTGALLPLQLAWREAGPLLTWGSTPPPTQVMFEWRAAAGGPSLAKQGEPLPWPIERWGRRALLRSRHDVITPPTLAGGQYALWVRLHTGADPAGPPFLLGTIAVVAPPHVFDLPPAAIPVPDARLGEKTTLAGYELDPSPSALALTLYWRTEAPLRRGYKVFAQLLDAENNLMAQSDSFPAAGRRPTTGWVPGEIIADSHTLLLPAEVPAGPYRLITGLYDPLTGERLPRLDEQGQASGDSILVTEVSGP